MAAIFAHKQGGSINVLKLIKLLYLADRESLKRYGAPISFDNFVSMDNGPVLSKTLDLINGFVEGSEAAKWDEWLSDREQHTISLMRNFERNDLDELSEVDLEIINTIWKLFGHMDQWSLVDYTHKYCSEWKNPHGSQCPINDEDILIAVGIEPAIATDLAENIQAQRKLDIYLSRL